MSTPNAVNDIAAIHAAYCRATGFQLRLSYPRERAWHEYLSAGFTIEDLLLVIEWIKREIRSERRREASLLFRNLVEQVERFEEDRALAMAHARRPQPTARDRALAALRPVAPNQTTSTTSGSAPRPASDVAQRALEAFKQETAKIFG